MVIKRNRPTYKGELRDVSALEKFQVAEFVEDMTIHHTQAKAGDLIVVRETYREPWEKGLWSINFLDEGMVERRIFAKETSKIKVLTGTKAASLRAIFQKHEDATPPVRVYPMIGSDPEIFVSGSSGLIPAWMFLGSKKAPSRASGSKYYGSNNLYWDGFQAEFDTKPVDCIAYACDSIQSGLQGVYREARKFDKTAVLSNKTVLPVDPKILKTANPEHVQFGCMPSKNVYGLSGSKEDGRDTPIRFVGGHIHFGTNLEGKETQIVKAMDSILGVACVSMFADYDSPIRRKYYGLPGEYRTPAHGIEYRTLSNGWLMHPLLANVVLELARISLAYGIRDKTNWAATEDETIQAIQQCNVNLARKILDRNKLLLTRMLGQEFKSQERGLIAAKLFMNGVNSFIADPSNIVDNWKLNGGWVYHCEGKEVNFTNSFDVLAKGGKV